MSVKEVLVEDGIVVSERLCESRQTRGWDLLQGRFVRFMSDPAHVQDDPVLTVHINQVHLGAGCNITDTYQQTYRSIYMYVYIYINTHTNMRRLTTGIRSEKCVVRHFRRCANVIECTYTNLDSIAYYTPSLHVTYSS